MPTLAATLKLEIKRLASAEAKRALRPLARLRRQVKALRLASRSVHMTRLEFAKLVGVSPGSIFGWETGRTIPRGASRARLIELRRQRGGAARPAKGRRRVRKAASSGTAARSRNGRRSRRR
jgi:DNA-binding transcriptional regulator YiaG